MTSSGGAITSVQSHVYLHGRSDFIGNQGNTSGAIFGRDSVFSISGDTRIANNKTNSGLAVVFTSSKVVLR